MDKLNSAILSYFADIIKKETGIIYSGDNVYQLDIRLNEICRALDLKGLEALYELSLSGGLLGTKKQLLLDTATNNETSFFRDPKIFKAFENYIIPEIQKMGLPGSVRIWSVASSFGQEPYSLSMILQQQSELGKVTKDFEILTTDISQRALERVAAAEYSQLEVQRGLPAMLLVKYFEKIENDYWKLRPEIKNRVKSKHMNLLNIVGVSGVFNAIFCRNVLIYQNEESKKQIVAKLASFLPSGGFFILGAAESLMGISDEFEQVSFESAYFYRKK
jgi:chemotaxis protein methyltransferase CheR